MIVKIYYTRFQDPLPQARFQSLLSSLPVEMANRIKRYRRWQDAHAGLFGKLLLQQGLFDNGLNLSLEDLQLTDHQRPYFDLKHFDFNISHSGDYVVCALGFNGRLGIDIEAIRPLDLLDFKSLFHPSEWQQICTAQEPLRAFFSHWTRKEAVIKADGHGLSTPLAEVSSSAEVCTINEKNWYLMSLPLEGNYHGCLATSKPTHDVTSQKSDFYKQSADNANYKNQKVLTH